MIEKQKRNMNERILNLTLEVIYLLTGEECIIVKKPPDDHMTHVSQSLKRKRSPMMEPTIPYLISEINNKKILEVTQKIIELLTGEVPIRCQDVTIYFSMEEWEYLEGHKDLYKDIMMEKRPPLTSADGPRNTPERCPRPLDSQDYTQEEIPQTCPLYSQDSAEEHQEISQEDQDDNLILVKIEDNEVVVIDDPCKEEKCSPEISSDSGDMQGDIKTEEEEEILVRIKEEEAATNIRTNGQHVRNKKGELLFNDPFTPAVSFLEHSPPISYHTDKDKPETAEKHYMCPECGKCFTQKSTLTSHLRIHTGERPYSCSQCGKCFNTNGHLRQHQRIHTGLKPYSCSECGKCFTQKATLISHLRIHTGERPYPCSQCGKCFNTNTHLIQHQRVHTRVKPYACSECGKCFTTSTALLNHKRTHTGEKPYSCLQCGKRFIASSGLIYHNKTHMGVKPYSCSECGKCFTTNSAVVCHKRRTHDEEKPFSCSKDEKGFTETSALVTHNRSHTKEKPYSCSECGKCFSNESFLVSHMSNHTG